MATPVILLKEEAGRVELTKAGLKLVEKMARDDKTLRSIAAKLGIPFRKLDKMLDRNKGDNPERIAWEHGHADHEQHVRDIVRAKALGDVVELPLRDERGNPVEALDEHGKPTGETQMVRVQIPSNGKDSAVLLIWYTKQLGWSEKPTGPIVNENRIQIVLPSPMTTDEYFKTLGIAAPLDFRKDKTEPLPAFDIKDVTPDPAMEE